MIPNLVRRNAFARAHPQLANLWYQAPGLKKSSFPEAVCAVLKPQSSAVF
jgi:hypothetical protein